MMWGRNVTPRRDVWTDESKADHLSAAARAAWHIALTPANKYLLLTGVQCIFVFDIRTGNKNQIITIIWVLVKIIGDLAQYM